MSKQDSISNNKRIAKNTFFLYIRTFVILIIALYTSRVVLNALGVEDYGIYNVVGGFVAMFSLLSGALSNAISRYITFELGRGDKERLTKVFSTSVTVQIMLALIVIVIAEIVGIWFLNVKMNVPEGRLAAANWVFQCSLLTFAINLISIPYNACIIAHEHMNAFAYISILDSVLKLGAVFLLFIVGFDKLIFYALLLVCIAVFIRIIYGFYCKYHFEECNYHIFLDKKLIREMSSLAGWNMLGSSGAILNSHGINLLMNLFFGVKINAARGLAVQVNGAVTQFVNSFTTAVNPQITKSYAKGEKDYLFDLVMLSSKYSFFLMLLLAVPLITVTPYLLKIWLKTVPDYTILFVRLTLISSLLSTLSSSLYTLALATGKIKKYQIVVGSLSLSCFFITYFFYLSGYPVETAYYVNIAVQIVVLFARLNILSALVGLNIKQYMEKVVSRSLVVVLTIIILTYFCYCCFPKTSFFQVITIIIICEILTLAVIIVLGLTANERYNILKAIKNKRKL